MSRYPCSGCGLNDPEGRCFTETPADYALPEEGETNITLEECRLRYGGLAEVLGDPLRAMPSARATNHQRSIDSYCLGILIGDVSYSMKAFAESLKSTARERETANNRLPSDK